MVARNACAVGISFYQYSVVFLDWRVLADELLWVKPIKFEISIIIHFITLATLAALLSPDKRNGTPWKVATIMVVAAGLFETFYIFLQAARERESHYNISTLVESAMYGLMGLGAVVLVAGSFYLGYLLYREYQFQRNSVLLLSSSVGLLTGSILTLIIAGYLSSFTVGLSIQDDVEIWRLPLFSWYLNGQDLRIPHFFATHMMQIFPLYGLWLSRQNLPIDSCKTRLFYGAGIYSLVVVLLFAVALLLG